MQLTQQAEVEMKRDPGFDFELQTLELWREGESANQCEQEEPEKWLASDCLIPSPKLTLFPGVK